MTNEEMDRKIAEAVGWKFDPEWAHHWGSRGRWCESPTGERKFVHSIPKFSTDLNAIREAEQSLFDRDWDARDIFVDQLCRIMDPVNGYSKQGAIDIIDATAEQRARAFVETIGGIKP
jgi:hypothetical protein